MKQNRLSCVKRVLFVLAALAVWFGRSAEAQSTYTWQGTTTADWNTSNSWTPSGPPGSANTALFNTAGTITVKNAVQAQAVDNITFDTNAGAYTIGTNTGFALDLTSGGTIQIASTVTTTSKVETVNAPLVIEGNGATYTIANNSSAAANTDTMVFGGGITAGGSSGTTTLTFGGSVASPNSGTYDFFNGVIGNGASGATLAVVVSGSAPWGLTSSNTFSGGVTFQGTSGQSDFQVGAGSVVSTTGSLISGGLGTGTFTINGSGRVTFANNITVANSIVINVSNALYGSGITLSGTAGGNTLTNAPTITLGTNETISDLGGGSTINDVIQGNYSLTINAGNITAGSQLLLTGSNTYTGLTSISTGMVEYENGTAWGVNSAISTSSGGTILVAGGITGGTNTITLNSASYISAGATGELDSVSGTNTYNGKVALNKSVTISSDTGSELILNGAFQMSGNGLTLAGAGNGMINGPITGSTNGAALTVTSTGNWILSGSNSYTGTTAVNAGTLTLNASSLGGTSVIVSSNATLSALNTSTIGTSSAGSLTLNTGGVVNLQGGGTNNKLYLNNASGTTLTLGSGTEAIKFDLGSSADEIVLSGASAASMSGATVDIYINGLGSLSGGQQTLIYAPNGGLGTSGFVLETPTGLLTGTGGTYTLTLTETGTALYLNENLPVTTPPVAYWNGSQGTVWNTVNSNLANWSTAASGGTNTGLPPGSITDVVFATTSAAGTNTTLGTNTVINSLDFTSTNAFSIGTGANSLTLLATTTSNNTAPNGISVSSGAGADSISANVILGTNQTWTNNSVNAFTVSGNISGSNSIYALTKAGSGTLVLSGTNTYGGGTYINAGAISINTVANSGSAQALGTGSNVTFAGVNSTSSNAVLQYTGGNGTLGQNITVSTGDYGLVDNSGGGVLTLSGAISKNGSVLDLAGGEFIVSGVISGSSNSSDLDLGSTSYPGTATVALDNANTYNGPTYISDGSTLITGTNNALPTSPASPVTLGTNSDTGSTVNTLDLDGNSETVASLTANGSGLNQVISSNATVTGGSIGSGTGNSGPTGLLTVNTTTNDPFSGNLGGGANGNNFSLTKSGPGTLTLSGNNTYTGNTTISGGAINVTGTTKNTSTTVATGGLLQGSGTVGAITVQSGATLSPGFGYSLGPNLSTSSNNVLTAASLTVSGGATLSYNLYNTTASTGTSANPAGGTFINLGTGSFISDGSVNTTSNQIMLNFNYTASSGAVGRPNVYDLVEFGNPGGTNDMTNLTAADFSIVNLSNVGSTATVQFVYLGSGEEALQLDVIPEPSTWAMFAVGLGLLAVYQRRKKKLS